MEIRFLTSTDHAAYSEFLKQDPRSLIYASAEYRDFLSAIVPGKAQCLLALDAGRILGALPYFEHINPNGRILINSLPWYGSHGGCVVGPAQTSGVRKALLLKYLEITSRPEVLSATMILSPYENRYLEEYLEITKPVFTEKRMGQMTSLPEGPGEPESALLQIFSKKTRNLVRKSLKQNFKTVLTDEMWAWEFLHRTHRQNILAVKGRAKPWEHFLALRRCFPDRDRKLYLAMSGDEPVAGLLLLFFNRTVEYFVPVIDERFRPQQPLSQLIFNAMADAVRQGYRWWNWGGTWLTQTSLYHFKQGWGARDLPYTYLIQLTESGLEELKQKSGLYAEQFPFYYTHPYGVTGCLSHTGSPQ
ncbi:MAG: GNAT family N-acetyltransferase [Candidatus Omnitrophica bacterium]|nr:GNAT family N-acetyltransferase [Candidatus Omnitrophota bacterium]MDD5670791.1 GNAT family N-acetyltransferase [Candidatus Omnitrophota bacterium]